MKTPKTNLMKLAGIASLLTLTVVMTSCGFNSDPRSKFDVPSVPKHNQPVDIKRVYKDAALFVLKSGNMNFVEGNAASFTIETVTPYKDASYRLTSSNLPDGAVLSPVSGQKGAFKLTWTPKVGTLPAGKTAESYTFMINVEVDAKSTTADSASLREIVGPDYQSMTVTLNKTSEEPTIESIVLASDSVVEGQPVAVTVVGQGPGIPADGTLTLSVLDSQTKSNELTIVSAKDAVTFEAPVRDGDKFTYTGLIETKLLKIPAGKKPVQARLSIKLTNTAFDRSSSVETKTLKIERAAPEPTAVPEVKVEPAKPAEPTKPKEPTKPVVKKTTPKKTTKPTPKATPKPTTKKTTKPEKK